MNPENVPKGQKAIFLDRDGTLNEEGEYVYQWENFKWISGVKEALLNLNALGYQLFVVSNQSGIARGYYTKADVEVLHEKANQELQSEGIRITEWLYCPHHPTGSVQEFAIECACRKPAPGLLKTLQKRYGVDFSQSWMIGDKIIDAEVGLACGCKVALVKSGHSFSIPSGMQVQVFEKLLDFSDHLSEIIEKNEQ